MMHIISSPQFTEYSQERLRSRVPHRVEEPEGTVPTWAQPRALKAARRNVFSAISFDGLRRLFGAKPQVRHS